MQICEIAEKRQQKGKFWTMSEPRLAVFFLNNNKITMYSVDVYAEMLLLTTCSSYGCGCIVLTADYGVHCECEYEHGTMFMDGIP